MGLCYKISPKELLEVRNKVFLENGLTALYKTGFSQSPFSTSWFGRNNLHGYSYVICRLSKDSVLEYIIVHISRRDKWVKIFLNIFKLHPEVKSLKSLEGLEGTQYGLPPNSITQMRLRADDYKGIPLFYMLFRKRHKFGRYCTKSGFRARTDEFAKLIGEDMANIDSFVKRWHQMHQPNQITLDGCQLEHTTLTIV